MRAFWIRHPAFIGDLGWYARCCIRLATTGPFAETMPPFAASAGATWDSRGSTGQFVSPRATSETAWFAVWTRSRHETAVRSQLLERGVETFLPTVPRWSRWKDRRKRIDWPLFPGYCFVRVAPEDSLLVRKCHGVVSIIAADGRPAPIPDREIEDIRALVESDLQYDPCPLVREGDRVQVVSGPLRGVTGRLVRKGAHARLVLSVDLIGQGVSVEVDAADVRPY